MRLSFTSNFTLQAYSRAVSLFVNFKSRGMLIGPRMQSTVAGAPHRSPCRFSGTGRISLGRSVKRGIDVIHLWRDRVGN